MIGEQRIASALWLLAGLSCALGCGSRPTRSAAASPIATAPASASKVVPDCARPAAAAVIQVGDDPADSRVVLVEIPSGRSLWTGPAGSGADRPAWSPDGELLLFANEEDLLAYEVGKPPRVVYRGLGERGAGVFEVDPQGEWVAVGGDDGVALVRLRGTPGAGAREVRLSCEPNSISWHPSGRSLLALCSHEDPNLFTIDASSGAVSSRSVYEVDEILGWRGSPPRPLVNAAGAPALLPALGVEEVGSPLRPAADWTQLTSYIPRADLFLYVDAAEDIGYEQAHWLAAPGQEPPWVWLHGYLKDFAFSRDGAWALFVTPTDPYEEWGDVHVARVGSRETTRVLQAPRFLTGQSDGDEESAEASAADPREATMEDFEKETEEGEEVVDEEDTPVEEPDDYPSHLGFSMPVPRPRPGACRAPSTAPAYTLAVESRIDLAETDAELLASGVVLIRDEGDRITVKTQGGTRTIDLDPERYGAVENIFAMRNGNLVLSLPGSIHALGPTGAELWERKSPVHEGIFALADGGIAVWRPGGSVDFIDAQGRDRGLFQTQKGIREVWSRDSNHLVVVDEDSNAIVLDHTGREVTRIPLDVHEPSPPAILKDGATAFASYDDDGGFAILFADAKGVVLKRHPLEDGADLSLFAPADDRAVAVVRAGMSKLIFFDAGGKLVATLPMGVYAGLSDPAVLDDGTLIAAGGERSLYLVGADGEYLGGRVLQSAIISGPEVAGPNSVAVATEEEILFLQRRPR